jgi:hypothetical protein
VAWHGLLPISQEVQFSIWEGHLSPTIIRCTAKFLNGSHEYLKYVLFRPYCHESSWCMDGKPLYRSAMRLWYNNEISVPKSVSETYAEKKLFYDSYSYYHNSAPF